MHLIAGVWQWLDETLLSTGAIWWLLPLALYATFADAYDSWKHDLPWWGWDLRRRQRWSRPEPESATEAEDDSAEAETAMFIKAKCQVGMLFAARLSEPAEDLTLQRARYEDIRNECMATADKLTDEFYKGFAVHQIIKMCVAAEDMSVARALFMSVQDSFLRERIIESAPTLR
jgi:hypothetical protein